LYYNNSRKYQVDIEYLENSPRYRRDFRNVAVISYSGIWSTDSFSDFINFLTKSEDPPPERASDVVEILKDWEMDWAYKYLLSVSRNVIRNDIIIRNQKQYKVSKGIMTANCVYCSEFYKQDPDGVICTNDQYSDDSFKQFIEMVHSKGLCFPIDEFPSEIIHIVNFWKCQFIIDYLAKSKNGFLLDSFWENPNFEDIAEIEKTISLRLKDYISNENIGKIPIPSLLRIFEMSQVYLDYESSTKLIEIMKKNHHLMIGVLIPYIKINPKLDNSELVGILKSMENCMLNDTIIKSVEFLQYKLTKLEEWNKLGSEVCEFDKNVIQKIINNDLESIVAQIRQHPKHLNNNYTIGNYTLTIQQCALFYNSPSILEFFLSFEYKNFHNLHLMHYAAENGFLECIDVMLKAGANINHQDETYQLKTILIIACEKKNEPMTRFLIDQGADPRISDTNGVFPLNMPYYQGLTIK